MTDKKRQAVLVFAPDQTPPDGDGPLDLFGFLMNELEAEGIDATLVRVVPEDADVFIGTEGVVIGDEDDRPCHCASCDWKGKELELGKALCEINHLWERLEPGEITPVGECPECGALAYLDEANTEG